MRTIAILPIKSFGAAKQRLSGLLGGGSREALAQAMFSDVLASLRHVPDLAGVAVVTANRVAEDTAMRTGVTLLTDTEEAGQSAAAQIGLRHAIDKAYERALLVPGDTPLLDPLEVAAMFDRADEDALAVTIVPDRHGEGVLIRAVEHGGHLQRVEQGGVPRDQQRALVGFVDRVAQADLRGGRLAGLLGVRQQRYSGAHCRVLGHPVGGHLSLIHI